MASKDSDYDVRFVFVHPLGEYLKISDAQDVITGFFDKDGRACGNESAIIDIEGFDIFKFAKLLSTSNPNIIGWLQSDIVYTGKVNRVFRDFAFSKFSRIALYFHYKSLCRSNYVKYIKSKKGVTHKKYLYVFRGLTAAKWATNKKALPPIVFVDALNGVKDLIPERVFNKLNEIIKIKAEGKEKEKIENIRFLDDFVESFLADDSDAPPPDGKPDLDVLNKEIRNLILK